MKKKKVKKKNPHKINRMLNFLMYAHNEKETDLKNLSYYKLILYSYKINKVLAKYNIDIDERVLLKKELTSIIQEVYDDYIR